MKISNWFSFKSKNNSGEQTKYRSVEPWFYFEAKNDSGEQTKYRSVLEPYFDWNNYKDDTTRWLEFKIGRTIIIKLFGITLRSKYTELWCKVTKPNYHLCMADVIDLSNGKYPKSPILETNLTLLFVTEKVDGDLNLFIEKWPNYDKYMEEYYWPEVKRVVLEQKQKQKTVETPKIIELN